MFRLNYRYRKYVWVAVAVPALLLLYFLVYSPLRAGYLDAIASIEMAEVKLEHSRRLVNQHDSLLRELQQMEGHLKTLESSMFHGGTTALVGANIQEIINTVCLNNGADIKQTRVLEVKEAGPYKEISISMDMISSLEGLARIIFDINNSPHLFLVPEMDARTTGTPVINNIRARMTVVGFMKEQ